jgi:hypothetical protein
MSEETILIKIAHHLGCIAKMSAMAHVSEKKDASDILFLKRIGFTPNEIAAILGKTRNAIDIALSRSKKSKRHRPNKE